MPPVVRVCQFVRLEYIFEGSKERAGGKLAHPAGIKRPTTSDRRASGNGQWSKCARTLGVFATRTQASVTRTTRFLGSRATGPGERVDIETLIGASRQTVELLLDRLGHASDKSACAIEKLREVELARARSRLICIAGLGPVAAGE